MCEICGQAFTIVTKLRKHVECVHEKQRNHPCKICGKFFRDEVVLKKHIQGVHEGVKFKCDICGNEFSQQSGVYTHKKFVHKINNNIKSVPEKHEEQTEQKNSKICA